MDHNFHVASVPTFRLAVHLRRLVDAGYKARTNSKQRDGLHASNFLSVYLVCEGDGAPAQPLPRVFRRVEIFGGSCRVVSWVQQVSLNKFFTVNVLFTAPASSLSLIHI